MILLFLVGLLICAAIVGTKGTNNDLVTKNKWLCSIPFFLAILLLYSVIQIVTESVPQGERLTSLVEVKSEAIEGVFYYNLLIDVYESSKSYMKSDGEEASFDYRAYEVVGIVTPNTGELCEAEDSDSSEFGDECKFIISSNGQDVRYSTTINMRDVESSFSERIEELWIELLLEIAAFFFALYAGYISVITCLKNKGGIK